MPISYPSLENAVCSTAALDRLVVFNFAPDHPTFLPATKRNATVKVDREYLSVARGHHLCWTFIADAPVGTAIGVGMRVHSGSDKSNLAGFYQ